MKFLHFSHATLVTATNWKFHHEISTFLHAEYSPREKIETMDGQDPGARPRNWINFQFPFLAAAERAISGANLNAEVKLGRVDQSGEWRASGGRQR